MADWRPYLKGADKLPYLRAQPALVAATRRQTVIESLLALLEWIASQVDTEPLDPDAKRVLSADLWELYRD